MKKRDPGQQTTGRLEPLVRIGDPNEANLLAAQLRSEGIPVHVHGELSGPYPGVLDRSLGRRKFRRLSIDEIAPPA